MRYSRDKDINSIIKRLLKRGWFVKSSNKHLKIKNQNTGDVIVVPGSPSCKRAMQNFLHQARNAGVGIPTC